MNKGIAHILMMKLKDIPFLQKFGGLVSIQDQEDSFADSEGGNPKRITKRYPVTSDYCITKTECAKNGLIDFTPDQSYYGQLYFEDGGIEPLGREGRFYKYKSKLRCVVWLNTQMIVDAVEFEPLASYSIPTAVLAAIQDKLNTLEGKTSGFYQRIQITERSIPVQDKGIFQDYSYDVYANQYIMEPFEFFAIDYDVVYRINPECITELAASLEDMPCACESFVPEPAQYPCLNDLMPYTVKLRVGVDTDTGEIITPLEGILDLTEVEIIGDPVLGGIIMQKYTLTEDGTGLNFSVDAGEVTEGIITLVVRKKIVT